MYEKLTMMDVATLCGLPRPVSGRADITIRCPKCDSKRKHLNIDFCENVFRCPKCGFSGGIFDLYAELAGVSRDQARSDMYRRLKGSPEPVKPKWTPPPERKPLADIERRNAVYTEFLSRLPLANDHRENLHGRGLKDDVIENNLYKTTPSYGHMTIAQSLRDKFGRDALVGVPGFYRISEDCWTLEKMPRGILIPVRDRKGRIQGLQVRLDKADRRKYRWLSSRQRLDGSAAKAFCHITGAIRSEAIVTEGPLKADVIHALTGKTVIAVPGVNSLSDLDAMLPTLKRCGLQKIMTAYDMDMADNPHVRQANDNLAAMLTRNQIYFGSYYWDKAYKGLDDYIWHIIQAKHT